jgi:curli biogenesis system outer membrane secretion channel CsgG
MGSRLKFIAFLLSFFPLIILGCVNRADEGGLLKPDISPSVAKITKIRCAVVGFDVYTKNYGVQEIEMKTIDMLSTALFRTGRFDLVERKNIEKVIQEQKFQQSGMIDTATALKMGKLLGARAVVTGAVTEIGVSAVSFIADITTVRVSIDVRVIDVETGKILAAETGDGRSSARVAGDVNSAVRKTALDLWIGEALRKAIEDVAKKIAHICQ